MNILVIYLVFFSAELFIESFLEVLNLRRAASTHEVPPYFRNQLPEDDFKKSIKYTIRKGKFHLFSLYYEASALLLLVFSGLFGKTEALLSGYALHPFIYGIFFIYVVMFILSLLTMPLKIYSEFVIEKEFGFSRMTLKLFVSDLIKGTLIGLLLSFPLLCAIFWFMDSAGSLWWVYAFVFTAVFEIALNILYPVLIAPLFNKFVKLDDGTLRERLLLLAERTGFSLSGIFKMDGSKRSRHSNAYFTGFGKIKRIVLFDTLLNLLEEDEIEAVLAHEIGHYKKHHLVKGIILSLFILLAGFFIISLLAGFDPLFRAFGFTHASSYGIIVLLMLYAGPFTFLLTPFLNYFSRRHEYEADSFAVNAVEKSESLKNALLKLGRENLSNLVPHRLYSFYHYSHPALYERLSAMDNPRHRR